MEFEITYEDSVCYNLRTYFDKEPGDLASCPMCLSTLEKLNVPTSAYGRMVLEMGTFPVVDFTHLYTCTQCKWWAIRESGIDAEIQYEWDAMVAGVAKKWDLSSKEVPISVLRNYFEKNNRTLEFKVLDAHVFEKLIAECLKYEYQPCEVYHVGARGGKGDDGVDIYLIKEETEWLIQVKRRLTDSPEPVDTIRLLNGVLLRDGKYNGMVVTSASTFTRNAATEVSIKTPGSYCIKLINRGDILRMLAQIPQDKSHPWQKGLGEHANWQTWETLSEEFGSLFLKRDNETTVLRTS